MRARLFLIFGNALGAAAQMCLPTFKEELIARHARRYKKPSVSHATSILARQKYTRSPNVMVE